MLHDADMHGCQQNQMIMLHVAAIYFQVLTLPVKLQLIYAHQIKYYSSYLHNKLYVKLVTTITCIMRHVDNRVRHMPPLTPAQCSTEQKVQGYAS